MPVQNTLTVQFVRNYSDAPFDGMVFPDDATMNAYISGPFNPGYAGQKCVSLEGAIITSYVLNIALTTWVADAPVASANDSDYHIRQLETFSVTDPATYFSGTPPVTVIAETVVPIDGSRSAKLTQSSASSLDRAVTPYFVFDELVYYNKTITFSFDFNTVDPSGSYRIKTICYNGTIDVEISDELLTDTGLGTYGSSFLVDPTYVDVRFEIFTEVPNDAFELTMDNFRLDLRAPSTGGGGSALLADIDVLDVTQGNYSDGDNIPAGTDFEEIFNNMLSKVVPPTYSGPSLSLSGSGTKTVETGTLISTTMTPTFNQNDAGLANNYELFNQAASIFINGVAAPHVVVPFNIGDESIIFNAELDYDIGPIKNDNTGTPDPTGQIPAGQVTSNNVTFTGRRRLFYGIDGDLVNIRTNPLSFLGPSNGTSRSFSGTGAMFVFAYPDTLRDITAATLTSSGFTFNILSEINSETDQMVDDANGGSPINYKVFSYTPAAPFTSGDFVITI